jgi:hypothetical protein
VRWDTDTEGVVAGDNIPVFWAAGSRFGVVVMSFRVPGLGQFHPHRDKQTYAYGRSRSKGEDGTTSIPPLLPMLRKRWWEEMQVGAVPLDEQGRFGRGSRLAQAQATWKPGKEKNPAHLIKSSYIFFA